MRDYSITSSAIPSTPGGIERRSTLAVLRLMTSSYLVGACTGRSAGFSPGGTFRARFGVERNGVSPLAAGSYSEGSEIKDGYPEFTLGVLKKLGWDGDLTPQELAVIQRVGGDRPDTVAWSTDLSGSIQREAIAHGCSAFRLASRYAGSTLKGEKAATCQSSRP
jgi:hypothetical protein